jgi:hypothetical protein
MPHAPCLILFLFHLKIAAALTQFQVPLPGIPEPVLKAVAPSVAFRSFNKMCKECEVVTLGYQGITVYTQVPVVEQVSKYPAVAPQLRVHVADIIVLVPVKTIVVVVPALV